MDVFSFEKLEVYQQARILVKDVYKIAHTLPTNEKYALIPQLQRAIVSVLSNIAEGSGRMSTKEKIHFLEIAYGSLMEAYCQLETCRDLNYITDETLKSMKLKFIVLSRLLSALRYSYSKKQL